MNRNVTWDIIQDNLDKPWDWEYILIRPDISWDKIEVIMNDERIEFDFKWIWENPNAKWDEISEHCSYLNDPEVCSHISMNSNVTWDIIMDNPHVNWSWPDISKNSNLTWKIIHDNPDKSWDWKCISKNIFLYDKYSIRYKQYQQDVQDELSLYFTEKGISRIITRLI